MNQVIATENAEWVTVRDAMRGLNGLVDELERGDGREKIVLTSGGKMRAVVLSIEEYAKIAPEIDADNTHEPMWLAGAKARHEREPLSANPYEPGGEHDAWERGWVWVDTQSARERSLERGEGRVRGRA